MFATTGKKEKRSQITAVNGKREKRNDVLKRQVRLFETHCDEKKTLDNDGMSIDMRRKGRKGRIRGGCNAAKR